MENTVRNIRPELSLDETRTTDLGYLNFINGKSDYVSKGEGKVKDFRYELEAKRSKFARLANDKEMFLEIGRRIKLSAAYLNSVSDKDIRKNYIYNAILFYLNGNRLEAGNYVKMLGADPQGFMEWLLLGKKIRKSALELKKLFRFMEQNQCADRFVKVEENEEFCRAMNMLINNQGCNKELLDYMDSCLKENSKEVSKMDAMIKSLEIAVEAYSENDNVAAKNWDGIMGGFVIGDSLMAANA